MKDARVMSLQKNEIFSIFQNKRIKIWILVVDLHTARLFRKDSGRIKSLTEITLSTLDPTLLYGEDKGRKSKPPSILSFIENIARYLESAVGKDAFDRLVLVAPPQALGGLRQALPGTVQARIIAEINRNPKIDSHDLYRELESIVWF
jgi:protein required for attachment to host cells